MLRKTLPAILTFAVALPAFSAARLTYQLNGVAVPVSWNNSSFPLRYAIDRRVIGARAGVQDVISRAFAEWTGIDGANLTFAPAGVVDTRTGRTASPSPTTSSRTSVSWP
jgi:hypothetical protein